jgi:hypothetical protein
MANKNGNERLGGRALAWRVGHMRSQHGVLPNLFFFVDRSWLVSALWDDAWTCVGGTDDLIDRLRSWPHGASARAGFLTATDPPHGKPAGGLGHLRRQEGADRGSRITTAVSDDRSAA